MEIIELAGEWNLRPEVVEKDYVLGWVLAALSQDPGIRDVWILKDGTCVKKCFFETYRFSEDLDFTLLPSAAYDTSSIAGALRDLGERAQEVSGLRFNPAEIMVKDKDDALDRPTFEGRIGYQEPLAMPGWPRIRFDISQHEQVVVPPVSRPVLHPYSDTMPADARVLGLEVASARPAAATHRDLRLSSCGANAAPSPTAAGDRVERGVRAHGSGPRESVSFHHGETA